MKDFYITKQTCKKIKQTIAEKELSYKEVADMVDSSASTICRICNGETQWLRIELVQKLEIVLQILIDDALQNANELIKTIETLEAENKMLKQLLIEKWQGNDFNK